MNMWYTVEGLSKAAGNWIVTHTVVVESKMVKQRGYFGKVRPIITPEARLAARSEARLYAICYRQPVRIVEHFTNDNWLDRQDIVWRDGKWLLMVNPDAGIIE